MLDGSYKFSAVRIVEIAKKDGKTRKLGVGSPREKIVQKALHILLSSIFEPLFLECSHGFRPNKSTHSALNKLYMHGDDYS
jgi:RNA-directed DNA polymerase